MKRKIAFLFIFIALIFSSCRLNQPKTWSKYSYEQYDGYLYIGQKGKKIHIVLCLNVAGIEGSFKMQHECTPQRFETVKQKLNELGATYLGDVAKPDTENYPDLSAYITFVMSSDELHQLWVQFGLEE